MFPVTITLQNAAQLTAVMQALGASSVTFDESTKVKSDPAKKPTPAPAATTAAGASSQTTAATPASAPTTAPESAAPGVTFDVLKKAFLALSTKAGGRALCEGVLKPHALAKLSDAKEEQYGALLDAINKAAA
jgi:hypothetical protein